MRHALASLLLALFLFPSIAFGETMDDLVKRQGLYYKKDTDVPFTGKVTGQEQGKIRNGKVDGSWVYYWKNGQLWGKGTYKDDGPWIFYHNTGNVDKFLTGTYKNGVLVK
tara:strand:+ start:541 stop:870 length:330 start_codon:yes stop_codon:yes gene_type:complete